MAVYDCHWKPQVPSHQFSCEWLTRSLDVPWFFICITVTAARGISCLSLHDDHCHQGHQLSIHDCYCHWGHQLSSCTWPPLPPGVPVVFLYITATGNSCFLVHNHHCHQGHQLSSCTWLSLPLEAPAVFLYMTTTATVRMNITDTRCISCLPIHDYHYY